MFQKADMNLEAFLLCLHAKCFATIFSNWLSLGRLCDEAGEKYPRSVSATGCFVFLCVRLEVRIATLGPKPRERWSQRNV